MLPPFLRKKLLSTQSLEISTQKSHRLTLKKKVQDTQNQNTFYFTLEQTQLKTMYLDTSKLCKIAAADDAVRRTNGSGVTFCMLERKFKRVEEKTNVSVSSQLYFRDEPKLLKARNSN